MGTGRHLAAMASLARRRASEKPIPERQAITGQKARVRRGEATKIAPIRVTQNGQGEDQPELGLAAEPEQEQTEQGAGDQGHVGYEAGRGPGQVLAAPPPDPGRFGSEIPSRRAGSCCRARR